MAKRNGSLCRAIVALGGMAAIGAAAATQQQAPPPAQQRPPAQPAPASLAALGKLQAGMWQLRDLDRGGAELPPVCLGDPAVLVQLRHRGASCSRRVVAQGPATATVHYTCPVGGFGQTLIRVETPRLVQIETQGITGTIPFASRVEARRVGSCGAN